MKVLALLILVIAAVIQGGEISKSLKACLARGEVLDVMIDLPSVDDIFTSPAVLNSVTKEKGTATMIELLKERTANSRRPFVKILSQLGFGDQRSISNPIWISNRFEVKNCDDALATVLAKIPGNFIIREQKVLQTEMVWFRHFNYL